MDTAGMGGWNEQTLLLHLVDLVLAVSLLELLWLLGRRPAAMPQLLPNLLAGLSLILALRLGLGGAGLAWIAPCLAAAGVAHLLDLRARRQPPERQHRPALAPIFTAARRTVEPNVRPNRPKAASLPSSPRPEIAQHPLPTAPGQGHR